MNLEQLRDDIRKRRKNKNRETYENIAAGLGIEKAMVKYIETHENYKPSRRMRKILKLDPDVRLAATRKRRGLLDEVGRELGLASWCEYETQVLNEYKKRMEAFDADRNVVV